MKIKEIVKITGGKLLSGSPAVEIDPSRISTDSRTIKKGDFFIALKGPNFDGNDFVKKVLKKGAIGAIISIPWTPASGPSNVIIRVKDTTRALQEIAAYHRAKFETPVICVTGSNGKTTVKDMIWHILSSKYNVLRNEGTKNNHIGVPQTLLQLKASHDICVLELGTNHEGEIELLAAIAGPTAAVITNIGPSHLEFLKDLEGVFREKSSILNYLDKKGGLLILNGDDEFLSRIKKKGLNIIRYGFGETCDLRAEARPSRGKGLIFVLNNRMIFSLAALGLHNIYNAQAAIAVALSFGLEHRLIRQALSGYKPAGMRLALENIRGIDIVNDSYNSNPLSMMKALEVVKSYPARAKWIVSGDMLELGDESERFHRMIGEVIAKAGIEGLMTFGKLSRHTLLQARALGMAPDRLWHCSTHDEIAEALRKVARPGDVVLVKGSRGMGMEKVLEKLKA